MCACCWNGAHVRPCRSSCVRWSGDTHRAPAPQYARVAAPAKRELRTLYVGLCKDDTPMVRRAAARAMGACVKAVGAADVKAEVRFGAAAEPGGF